MFYIKTYTFLGGILCDLDRSLTVQKSSAQSRTRKTGLTSVQREGLWGGLASHNKFSKTCTKVVLTPGVNKKFLNFSITLTLHSCESARRPTMRVRVARMDSKLARSVRCGQNIPSGNCIPVFKYICECAPHYLAL